jgi:hypothetical protein
MVEPRLCLISIRLPYPGLLHVLYTIITFFQTTPRAELSILRLQRRFSAIGVSRRARTGISTHPDRGHSLPALSPWIGAVAAIFPGTGPWGYSPDLVCTFPGRATRFT